MIWQRIMAIFRPAKKQIMAGTIPPKPLVPTTHPAALASLVDTLTVKSNPYRARLIHDHEGIHPDILAFSKAFLRDLHKLGIPMYPHTFVRNEKAQTIAFEKGNSKAKFGSSPHNFGKAVDIVHYWRSWDLTPKEWANIGAIGKETARRMNLKITWGGDWNFYDPAHWELKDWRNYA